jgi:hypothetical protein
MLNAFTAQSVQTPNYISIYQIFMIFAEFLIPERLNQNNAKYSHQESAENQQEANEHMQ